MRYRHLIQYAISLPNSICDIAPNNIISSVDVDRARAKAAGEGLVISSDEDASKMTCTQKRVAFLTKTYPAEILNGEHKGSTQLKAAAKFMDLSVYRNTGRRITFYPRGGVGSVGGVKLYVFRLGCPSGCLP